jgi:beta-N-acetylglucosaminidase
MKAGIIILFFLFVSFFVPKAHAADQKSADSSATFADILEQQKLDTRTQVLKHYLEQFDSPLTQYAQTFVVEADLNHIPWDLVVAISGTESSFGKQAPAGSNNFYGYDIYADNVLYFDTVEKGIQTVSRAIRNDYIDKWHSRNVEDIGHLYASSPLWATHTIYFMHDIENYKKVYDAGTLSISL